MLIHSQNPPPVCCHPSKIAPQINPSSPEAWNYGYHRIISFLQSPPLGAGIIALALFFLLIFGSNILISQTTIVTLGITVTFSILGFLALVIIILFII